MSEKLSNAAAVAGEKLNEIAALFVPGQKITLLVRSPNADDQDFILTNDDLADAVKALQRNIK